MQINDGHKRKRLSVDDIDELIEMADDEKVQRFWQTIKDEKIRGGKSGIAIPRYKRFLSVPLYNNSIAVIFILAILSFSTWFLFKYTSIGFPFDITQPVLVVVFAFTAIMFHRYVADREEIVDMLDELAGYSIQNESVFENIGSALIVVDATGKVTKVNRKAENMLESTNSELVGKNCQHIFSNQKLADLLLETLRSSYSIANYEVELESRNGHSYSLQVSTSLIQNKRGHTIGAIEVLNDVTEIRDLQEKLKLNEHLAAIGELSAKLGHEIGNSLGGIKLFTDNLLEELTPEDHRRRYVEEILSEVDRLNSSVSELKDYSRPVSLNLKKTNINELTDEVISLTRDKLQENNIVTNKSLDRELPNIMIDQDQMKSVFLNIVINAIQAMPQGGKLNISTQRRNGILKILFSDTGTGIPENIRSKIFNPFFTTKKTLGTGLGLSIVYKTIQAHSANIKCDSEVGHGTTFTIELPMNLTTDE